MLPITVSFILQNPHAWVSQTIRESCVQAPDPIMLHSFWQKGPSIYILSRAVVISLQMPGLYWYKSKEQG